MERKTIVLTNEQELRIEIEDKNSISFILRDGMAECIGTELLKNHKYEKNGPSNIAIFSFEGNATIEIEGKWRMLYTSNDTPMVSYLNAHVALHKLRKQAEINNSSGPKVLIVGPPDSGKSTLAQILANYAIRSGTRVTYVDVDVAQENSNMPAVPACISAMSLIRPIDIVEGFGNAAAPLVYFVGKETMMDNNFNNELYIKLVGKLAEILSKQANGGGKVNNNIKYGGMIINSFGHVEGVGLKLLLEVAVTLSVTNILVVGLERLWAELSNHEIIKSHSITVANLPKSTGAVMRNSVMRSKLRNLRVRQYFYGGVSSSGGELTPKYTPHLVYLSFRDFKMFRIGVGVKISSSALPINAKSSYDPLKVEEIPINADLVKKGFVNSILAVSSAKTIDDILTSNVLGFVHVVNIDISKMVVLSVCPAPLPSTNFIVGDFKWFDEQEKI